MILKDDNGKALPKKVQKRVNDFINHLPKVPWFNPSPDLKKEDVEKQVKFTLDCFGVKAKVKYGKLQKQEDWDSARDSAWASAWDSAWASVEVLLKDNADFKKKYPNGAFKQLFKLWEMGLYPVGVLKNKKFVIYVPPCKTDFPFEI